MSKSSKLLTPENDPKLIEAIDSLVSDGIKLGRLDNALDFAKFGASKEMIKFLVEAYIKKECFDGSLIEFFIEKEWLDGALEAAELLERALSAKEAESLIQASMKEEGRLEVAVEIAELVKNIHGVSQKVIDSLAKSCLDAEWLDGAIRVVGCGSTQQMIDKVAKVCINGKPRRIGGALCMANLGASQEVNDILIDFFVDIGRGYLALKVALSKFGASQRAIDLVVKHFVKIGDKRAALEAAELGASQEVIDLFLADCLGKKEAKYAMQIARLGASQEAIDPFLISTCVEQGWLEGAQEAAGLVGRNLFSREVKASMEIYIERGQVNKVLETFKLTGKKELSKEQIIRLAEVVREK